MGPLSQDGPFSWSGASAVQGWLESLSPTSHHPPLAVLEMEFRPGVCPASALTELHPSLCGPSGSFYY